MPKKSKNLSLDPEIVRRAERYSALHGTSVSRLVSNFLASLPLDEDGLPALSPAVRRLLGVATGSKGVDDYHRYLIDRYGH
ncbi:MAG: DUF6364 family protein [Longimicrobiales bacterium]